MWKHFRFVLVLLIAAGSVGCLKDSVDDAPVGRIGSDGIALNLTVPGMKTMTRAGFSETVINELDVAVFNASDVLVERATARIIGTEMGGGYVTQAYVPITNVGSGYTLMLVANAHERISTTGNIGQTTRSSFGKTLIDQKNSGNEFNVLWNQNVTTERGLPMLGEVKLTSAVPTSESLNVEMTRLHACLDFAMEDASSDFEAIYFNNFIDAGVLSGDNVDFVTIWGGVKSASYTPSAKFTAGNFYVFEASKTSEADDAKYKASPHIVVKAKYNGVYYYYRINLTSDGTLDGYAEGEYIPIMRNYRYRIVVNEVRGKGWESVAAATNSKGEQNNLSFTIHVEEEGRFKEMAYDSNYMLGVAQTSYDLSGDAQKFNILLTSNHQVLRTAVSAAAQSWLKLGIGQADQVPDASWAPGWNQYRALLNDPYTVNMAVYALENTGTTTRTATVTVSAGSNGRLSIPIVITQSPDSSLSITIVTSENTDTDIGSLVFGHRSADIAKTSLLVTWTPADADLVVSSASLGSRGRFGYSGDSDNVDDYTTLSGGAAIFNVRPPARSESTESGTYCTEYTFTTSFQGKTLSKTLGLLQSVPQTYSDLANCYIVPPATKYGGNTVKIPVWQATRTSLLTTTASKLQASDYSTYKTDMLWTDSPGGKSASGSVANVQPARGSSITDSYIEITPGTDEGNAVIAVYKTGSSTTILWTWHIWVTNYQPGRGVSATPDPSLAATPLPSGTTYTYSSIVDNGRVYHYKPTSAHKGNTLMDRNLGAVGVSVRSDAGYENVVDISSQAKKEATFGLTYQWGRKNPFPGAAGYSSQTAQKTIYGTGGSAAGTYTIQIQEASSTRSGYMYPNQNPWAVLRTHTSMTGNTFDWYTTSYNGTPATAAGNRNDELWSNTAAKSIDDPCPPGWRVPKSSPVGSTTAAVLSGNSTGMIPNGDKASDYTSIGNSSWDNIYSPWYGKGAAYTTDFVNDGGYFFDELGWYPAAGFRSSMGGGINNAGRAGGYWTCGVVGTRNAYRFYMANGMIFGASGSTIHDATVTYPFPYISSNNEQGRCRGFSVRCVVDD